MGMLEQGKSVAEMREVIIARYGKYGPSTDGGRPGGAPPPAAAPGRS
jgi:hypothetical protein